MSMLTIAGVQMDVAWEQPALNRTRAAASVEAAAHAGARLVVLPEMFATGFSMNAEAMATHAEETAAWASDLARAQAVWLLIGLATPSAPLPHNTAQLYDPVGTLRAAYHKVHPFTLAGEHLRFAAGGALATVEIEGVRVTPVICYDLRFPELFRACAQETDLFVVIANWPQPRRHHWSTLLLARAIESQAFVLGVNRVGEGGGLQYTGDSALIDPLGERRAAASVSESLIYGVVDPAEVASVRARFSFLADRRPSLYRQWAAD